MNEQALVLVERPFAGCAVVTLNRPRAMNALSLGLRRELVATFERAEAWGLVNRVVPPDELLPQAFKLVSDMLSVLPGMLPEYKRLIDDGLRESLAGGLQIENERSRAWAGALSGGDIERRREQI